MSFPPLRSDRVNGPVPPTHEQLQSFTSSGLIALVQSRLEANWLADEFPEICPDPGRTHVFATDMPALGARAQALIPELPWPLFRNRDLVSDDNLFDFVEFVARYIAEPENGGWHDYHDHYALTFDRPAGARKFREDVNEILSRGGAAYRMVGNRTVERVLPEELSATLSALNPATGDPVLDEQIERGRSLVRSRRVQDRLVALQALWGALEHLKTLELPGQHNKHLSAEQLLSHLEPEALRDAVRGDMRAVTDMGNAFRIRHQEAHIPAVPEDAHDYFAGRITNIMLLLLRVTDRLDVS